MTKIEHLRSKYSHLLHTRVKRVPVKQYIIVDEARKLYHVAYSGFTGRLRRSMGTSALPISVREYLISIHSTPGDRTIAVLLVEPIDQEEIRQIFEGYRTFREAIQPLNTGLRERKSTISKVWLATHKPTGVKLYVSAVENSRNWMSADRMLDAARFTLQHRADRMSLEDCKRFYAILKPFKREDWTIETDVTVPSYDAKRYTQNLNMDLMPQNLETLRTLYP